MRHTAGLRLILLVVLALAGCSAQRHRREADRPVDALEHYQAAIRADPRLAEDQAVATGLRRAQSRVAAIDAQKLVD